MKHLLHLKEEYERTLRILPPIAIPATPDSLLEKLLALILRNQVSSDEEAVAALYGSDKGSSYTPYQKLKNKFKLYLAYKICRLPLPYSSNPNNAKFSCRTFLLHGKTCKYQGLFRSAEFLFLAAYRKGEEIEQYSVLRDAAFELSELYSTALPNRQGSVLYQNAYLKYAQIEDIYTELFNTTSRLLKAFNIRQRRLTAHDDLLNEIKEQTISSINYNVVRYHSKLFTYYHKALGDIALLQADFTALKDRSLQAVNEADALTYQAGMIKKLFVENLILACCKLGLFEETLAAVKYRKELEGSNLGLNPYVYQYYQIIALLQLGRYKEAIKISSTIKMEEVMRLFSEQQATTYYILFAYQHILFMLGRTDEKETPERIQKFRFSRFRNQVQVQEKNKQGYNVHLLIIELFTLVLRQRFDTFIDRAEAMLKYVQRYLNDKENERNALFLKMLLSAAQHDFRAERMERAEDSSQKALAVLPNLAFDKDASSNEFLPFEVQWLLFLEALRLKAN